MWWMMLAKGAMSILGTGYQNALTRIDNNTARVNAASENRVRSGSNTLSAAQGSLEATVGSINNRRTADNSGDQLESLYVNAARSAQAQLSQDFEGSIRAAEQMGMQAVSAGRVGAASSVVDSINIASSLAYARANRAANMQSTQQSWDVSRAAASMQGQIAGGQDVLSSAVRIDYSKSVAQQKGTSSAIMGLLGMAANSPELGKAIANIGQGWSSTSSTQDDSIGTVGSGLSNPWKEALTSAESNSGGSDPYAVSLNFSFSGNNSN